MQRQPLPSYSTLPVQNLTGVFSFTTNSYKFYWFLSILKLLKEDSEIIKLEDLSKDMMEQVWYPQNVYKLSFGKSDSFKNIERKITDNILIDNSPSSKSLFQQIKTKAPALLVSLRVDLNKLLEYVPTRFIRPFVCELLEKDIKDSVVDGRIKDVAENLFESQPEKIPYKIEVDHIVLTPVWAKYFRQHRGILSDFTYYHLVQFLQRNNPNVIGIPDKIYKPVKRKLAVYTKAWQALNLEQPQKCIYTNKLLGIDFTLDHFIPWSYYTYDHAWNLAPTPLAINASKNDSLPSLSHYIDPFLNAQLRFFKFINKLGTANKIQDDYTILFQSPIKEIVSLSESRFCDKIEKEISMMQQKAASMGFGKDWVWGG